MDNIAVLIPCYNEAVAIGKVVSDFHHVLPEAVIYVYDNNSSDDTAIIAEKEGAIVRHEYVQGKGHVIRRMFREIDACCYLLVDGDDTYSAEASPEMCRLILERQVDMVIGDRLSGAYFTENKRRFHNFGNTLVRDVINRLFHCNIKDIMTGYRAFSYNFVKTFPVLSCGFEIETEMTIHAVDKNMAMESIVVEYRDRKNGSVSKLNTIPDGLKILRKIISLYKNYCPLRFFGVVSAFAFMLGLILFIPLLCDYLRTGLVARFPSLIVSCFLFTTSVLGLFTGIMLDSIRHKNLQDFEMHLLEATMQYKNIIQKNKLLRITEHGE